MFIKRPTPKSGRASYALIGDDGKTIRDPRVEAVNKDLKAGTPLDELEARMQAIVASYKAAKPTLSFTNLRLVEEHHRKKLKTKPFLADPDQLKQRLVRAAEWMGNLSLREATWDEITDVLVKIEDPSVRHEITRGVNELLKGLNRNIHIHNPKPPRPDEIDFIRVSDFLDKEKELGKYAVVLGALFATGCRWAELPTAVFMGNTVNVSRQLKKKRKTGEVYLARTKNKKQRGAPILPPLQRFVDAYQHYSKEERWALCLKNHKRVYYRCKKVLGIRVHDLRHSYAVEWGAIGCSTHEVADFIGDTEETARRHYLNYCATPDKLRLALNRFKGPA